MDNRLIISDMIYDSLDNLELYKGISCDIYEGLKFLKQAGKDIECGVHKLSPRVKAIVSEYETMVENPYGYEAHRRFIDIQFLLKGEEKVCSLPLKKLRETQAYNPDADYALYAADSAPMESIIGDGYFAIYFPQDGHMPNLCVSTPSPVKKVVMKIEIAGKE